MCSTQQLQIVLSFRSVKVGGQKNAGDQALCGDRTTRRCHVPGEGGAPEQNTGSHQGGLCFVDALWSFCLISEHLICGRNSTGYFIYTGSHLFFSIAHWSRYYFPQFLQEEMEGWRGYIICELSEIWTYHCLSNSSVVEVWLAVVG